MFDGEIDVFEYMMGVEVFFEILGFNEWYVIFFVMCVYNG